MLQKLIDRYKINRFIKQLEPTDKQFLLKTADMLDHAKFDETGCCKMSQEMAEVISYRLRKLGNSLVVK